MEVVVVLGVVIRRHDQPVFGVIIATKQLVVK